VFRDLMGLFNRLQSDCMVEVNEIKLKIQDDLWQNKELFKKFKWLSDEMLKADFNESPRLLDIFKDRIHRERLIRKVDLRRWHGLYNLKTRKEERIIIV
jgi:hypothetical protein